MHLFSFGKLFCDLFLLFILIVSRSGKREEVGKARRGEDAWSVKYEGIELCCSQRTIYGV